MLKQIQKEYIEQNYGKIFVKDIAKNLNVTPDAIYCYAYQLRKKGVNIKSKLFKINEKFKDPILSSKWAKEKWKDPQYLKKMEKRNKIVGELMKKNNPMFNKEIVQKAHIKAMETQKRPQIRAKRLGENHWNWEGGVSRIYSQRLKKENFEYVCFQCERKINVDIHHKDLNEKNNELSNLVPLCRGCHTDLHKLLKKYDNQSIVTLLS